MVPHLRKALKSHETERNRIIREGMVGVQMLFTLRMLINYLFGGNRNENTPFTLHPSPCVQPTAYSLRLQHHGLTGPQPEATVQR